MGDLAPRSSGTRLEMVPIWIAIEVKLANPAKANVTMITVTGDRSPMLGPNEA